MALPLGSQKEEILPGSLKEGPANSISRKAGDSGDIILVNVHAIMQILLLSIRKIVGVKSTFTQS